MERDKIEALLEKYWKAETTLEEERFIKNYLESNRSIAGFDEENNWFKAAHDFKSVKVKEVHFIESSDKIVVKKVRMAVIFKIAAAVLFVISASLWIMNYNRSIQTEQDQAMQKKVEADLFSISNSLNQANSGLNEIIKFKADLKVQNQ
jgi:hypothetical protein